MDIVFVQTSDADVYHDMMQATAPTVRAYCERHGCAYEAYVGVRRGYWPWQATFNRIYLLQELVERGRHDWAVYMDADALVADLSFDLKRYLARKGRFAAVMAPSGATKAAWDVNAGVLMFNLRHPFTAHLLAGWRAAYEAIPDAVLRAQSAWSNPNDQEMLQALLREDPASAALVHRAPRKLINGPRSLFIRQMVSAWFHDPAERMRVLRASADAALGGAPAAARASREEAEAAVDQVYRAVLRRVADPQGLAHFAPLMQELGYEAAAKLMIQSMLDSQEYAERGLVMRDPPGGGFERLACPSSAARADAPVPSARRRTSASFDPEAYVGALYLKFLGRPADAAGLADKASRLRGGAVSPEAVMDEVLASAEFGGQARAFLGRLELAERLGLFNDVTQYGELHLLLQQWLDRTAVARLVVDVGARGRERSNAYDLCRWFGWRALLVEANPAFSPGLARDFAGLDVEIAGCAVSNYDGRATLTLGANDDVSSLQPDMARAWGEPLGAVEVEVRRLPGLLAERGAPERFDLLSLDIEGEDVTVLNDLAADGRYRPDWVFLEASFDFATTRLEETGVSAAVLDAYALVGATRANLLLRRR